MGRLKQQQDKVRANMDDGRAYGGQFLGEDVDIHLSNGDIRSGHVVGAGGYFIQISGVGNTPDERLNGKSKINLNEVEKIERREK